MIIDCHAHVFQHWIGACGHESRHVHKRYMQKGLTRTVAKTFRTRDGAPSRHQGDVQRRGQFLE